MNAKLLFTALIIIGGNKLVAPVKPPYKKVEVCKVDNSSFKAYMDYRTITDTSSKQYAIISQSKADRNGLMKYEGKYLVALGSFYGDVGTSYKVVLSSGKEIKVIKADEKSDKHTIKGCANDNGSMIEFIVDTNKLDETTKIMGDANYIHDGYIKEIYKIEE